MTGARALWWATGMQSEDFEKPIIAIANSFTQYERRQAGGWGGR